MKTFGTAETSPRIPQENNDKTPVLDLEPSAWPSWPIWHPVYRQAEYAYQWGTNLDNHLYALSITNYGVKSWNARLGMVTKGMYIWQPGIITELALIEDLTYPAAIKQINQWSRDLLTFAVELAL